MTMRFRLLALLLPFLPALLAEDSPAARIDKVFASWNKPGAPGAAVAVIQHGKLVYTKGYGAANLEYNVPVVPETVFHVASVSKQFTAMAAVLLEQDGKLSLDDDVHRFLPELPGYGHKITVRHLLQHTSGVRDQWDLVTVAGGRMDDVITQQQLLRLLFRVKDLNFPPGTRYSYSNGGYTLAAEIVQRVSGMPFPEFCEKRIFRPLGMKNTHFHLDARRLVPGRAYSYSPSGDGFQASLLNYANVGATSLFTTAPDLALWLDNFRHAKVGGAAALRKLQERATLADGSKADYGLGLVVSGEGGDLRLSHGGADAGFRSVVVWYPALELGVAIVSNHSGFNPSEAAGKVAAFFGTPTPESRPNPSRTPEPDAGLFDPKDLPQYAGVYLSGELEVQYTLSVKAGRLTLEHPRLGDLGLTPRAKDRLTAPGFVVSFVRDPAGRVVAMTVATNRNTGVRFERR